MRTQYNNQQIAGDFTNWLERRARPRPTPALAAPPGDPFGVEPQRAPTQAAAAGVAAAISRLRIGATASITTATTASPIAIFPYRPPYTVAV